jgi:uncharacterized membrane-anchored protein
VTTASESTATSTNPCAPLVSCDEPVGYSEHMSSLSIALTVCAIVAAFSLFMWLLETVRTAREQQVREQYIASRARLYRR